MGNATIRIAAAALVLAILVYLVVFSENIKFELTQSGRLSYFQRGQLQNEFNLSKAVPVITAEVTVACWLRTILRCRLYRWPMVRKPTLIAALWGWRALRKGIFKPCKA